LISGRIEAPATSIQSEHGMNYLMRVRLILQITSGILAIIRVFLEITNLA
tara:strand:+ start:504 stop:653 length:150 start_codon:yes stop_codon:yes gene_type:complete